jgi:nicotinamide-nucleotide amidase
VKYVAVGAFPDITERKVKESARARVLSVKGSGEAALWTARRLRAIGYEVEGPVDVEVSVKAVEEAVRSALDTCDLVIVTGGVEPNSAPAFEGVAAALGRALVENEEAKQHVEEYYLLEATDGAASELSPLERARALTLLPEGSTVFHNPRGPAPGILLEEGGRYLICVPGSLAEAGAILEEEADPYVRSVIGAYFSTTVHVMTKTWEEDAVARVVEAVSEEAPWVFAQLKRTVRSKEGWGITVTVFAKSPDELSEKLVKAVEIVEGVLEREGIGFDKKDLSGL